MPDARIVRRGLSVASFYSLARERGTYMLLPGIDVSFTTDEFADIELCNALLDLEREAEWKARRRQWAALEALLPLIPPGGDVSEIVFLPRDHALRAARLALRCGWFW